MADKSINQLPVSDGLTDDGLLVVYQNNITQSIRGNLIKQFAQQGIESALAAAKDSGEFDGKDGVDGKDAVSPTIAVDNITGGHKLTITDKNGTETVNVMDGTDGQGGKDGADGKDGVSPTVSVVDITDGHRITIEDATGTKTVDVMNGTNGKDGANGVSATHTWDGTVLTIESASGASSADLKGEKGNTGEHGLNGHSNYYCNDSVQGADIGISSYLEVAKISPADRQIVVGDFITTADGLLWQAVENAGNTFVRSICVGNLKGAQGEAGYTPQVGVDYYTENEKQQLVEEIIAGLGGDGRNGVGENVAGVEFTVDGETVIAGIGAERFNYLYNVATGQYSHAEGCSSKATGYTSHAEGNETTAKGDVSHAEGFGCLASGLASHAEGFRTIARGSYSHVQGMYNIEDNDNKYAHIVGNGDYDGTSSNAHTLDWDGNAWFAGDVYIGGTGQDDPNAKKLSELGGGTVTSVNGVKPDTNGNVQIETGGTGGGIDVIAQAGQLIRVKEVDAEGRPTKWEAADDMPWVEQGAEGEIVHKLPTKFLPDGVPYCIDRGVGELLPATTVQLANMQAMIATSIPMTIGETYTVNWNGTEYECVAQDASAIAVGGVAVGNGEVFGGIGNEEPFLIGSVEGQGTLIYALDGSSETTFSVKGRRRDINKLDLLCMPDGAVGATLFDVNVEIIDLSAGVYTADKTFAEIRGAINSGNKIVRVLFKESDTARKVLNLVGYGSAYVIFSSRYLYDADGRFTENTVFIGYDNTVSFYGS